MNWDQAAGNWKQLKGSVKQQDGVSGIPRAVNYRRFITTRRACNCAKVAIPQAGIAKEDAEKQLHEWESKQKS